MPGRRPCPSQACPFLSFDRDEAADGQSGRRGDRGPCSATRLRRRRCRGGRPAPSASPRCRPRIAGQIGRQRVPSLRYACRSASLRGDADQVEFLVSGSIAGSGDCSRGFVQRRRTRRRAMTVGRVAWWFDGAVMILLALFEHALLKFGARMLFCDDADEILTRERSNHSWTSRRTVPSIRVPSMDAKRSSRSATATLIMASSSGACSFIRRPSRAQSVLPAVYAQ